ncbi:helix-turn-helix transcriptional regulator [Nocardiopsis dassonvillei]|uniref:helix-turn-helix domain-containing protein n=1 Tax=Nocardiopsis dassonvillei TaxID=2014 RepID=UPI00200D6AB5|nr:helix-turn-helix transcriptional regulator [Nocardiopsis dassonvillei]MCK9869191.1 helix-turn-helix transcriptional regulator [Nocardiopsis dassonvillei]
MPSSSPSSAQAAREAVASRLKEIRLDAGLTGTELALRCNWHKSKSSRIENAKTPPSDEDIRTWCRICTADDQADDLIAASRNAESLYVEWRRKQRAGLRHLQESSVPLYERTELFRVYTPDIIPGFLQTSGYAEALFKSIAEFDGVKDDIKGAAKARIDRSHVLRQGNHRFTMVLEEAALRYRIGDSKTMAGQLGHLLSTMSLPNVSIGIIPFTSPRPIWPMAAYYVFDDQLVRAELATAEVSISSPTEVAIYLKAFDRLQKLATYGTKARTLITSAIDELD